MGQTQRSRSQGKKNGTLALTIQKLLARLNFLKIGHTLRSR